jgi:ABC-type Zn uptake system ZnuABC Zn-binding protein ZnuA
MKKTILAIAVMFAMMSCGGSASTENTGADSTAVADSSVVATDSTVAKISGSEDTVSVGGGKSAHDQAIK